MTRLAKAKGVPVSAIRACLLDRDRHKAIIEELRSIGVGIRLIPDGDVAGVFWTTEARAQASISISAQAARPKACLPRRRSAARADKCKRG